jgi:hypothetical protein
MTNSIPQEVLSALPASWQVYAGVISALLVLVGAAGRAWHAWQNDSSVLKAMVFGTNTPPNPSAPTTPAPKP